MTDGLDSGETERIATVVALARIDGVEGDLEDDVGLDFAFVARLAKCVFGEMLGQVFDLDIGKTAVGFADY